MANGPGVSVQKLGPGRWRVRWREPVQMPDGTITRKERSKVVTSQATAVDLRAKVLRAMERGEIFEPEIREMPVVATVDQVLTGYLRAQAAKRVAPATIRAFGGRIKCALKTLRQMHGLPANAAVPGHYLTRDGVIALNLKLQEEGYAEGTIHGVMRTLNNAWTWASDDPTTYPGIASAPRDRSSVMPMSPLYAAAPAPTLAECDAVLRTLASSPKARTGYALKAAVIARYTGLRIGAVLSIHLDDLNLERAELVVRAGKSRREKAEQRTIPLAPPLVAFLRPLVADAQAREGWLLRRPTKGPDVPATTLRRAWKKAVGKGLARPEVWKPKSRAQGRPDHAFRAAFQHHLVEAGVRSEIIDLLVGHAGGLRESHYVDASALWARAVEAVALIPPVDWGTVSPP
jgi:integrase